MCSISPESYCHHLPEATMSLAPTMFRREPYVEQRTRRLRISLPCFAILLTPALLIIFGRPVCVASDPIGPKRILVLYSTTADTNLNSEFIKDMNLGLKSRAAESVQIYSEYLDLTRFSAEDYQHNLVDLLKRKYAGQQPDLVILVSRLAVQFGLTYREALFPRSSIIFCAIDERFAPVNFEPDITGIKFRVDIKGSIEAALRLQPEARNVVIVGGTSRHEKSWEAVIRREVRELDSRVSFTYLTNLPLRELERELARLPKNSIVYIGTPIQDTAGEWAMPEVALRLICRSSNAPVYGSISSTYLGNGLVGGHMLDLGVHGKAAADLALRILQGEKPDEIPVSFVDANIYLFDWHELKRWRINEKFLPADSTLLNKELSTWQLYHWHIVVILSVLLLEASLIAILLRQRADLQRVQASLRESEQRFRLMADTAPAMIWMSGADMGVTYLNKPWLVFTGRPMEEQLGSGWTGSVHPDDVNGCLASYEEAFNARRNFVLEYRLRRADGKYRWVLGSGMPRLEGDGSFIGYIGSCTDITEWKGARQALSDMGGQLINAQEAERSRIARELHDDLSQRLALLSTEIEQLAQQAEVSAPEMQGGLREALARTLEILNDVNRLAYELHPSKLDRLGLVSASKTLCREIGEKRNLHVEFKFKTIPDSLPRDIGLCLYRVLQESLHNVVKHSGARRVLVELNGSPAEIRLNVSDEGVGFDPGRSQKNGGLGLISMCERLRLVGGRVTIDSQPLRGTQIRASVPLGPVAATVQISDGNETGR